MDETAPAFFRVNNDEAVEFDSALHIFKDGKELVTVLPAKTTAMPSRHIHLSEQDNVLVEFYHRADCSPSAAGVRQAPDR